MIAPTYRAKLNGVVITGDALVMGLWQSWARAMEANSSAALTAVAKGDEHDARHYAIEAARRGRWLLNEE